MTRANAITAQHGLSDQLEFVKGDFMNLPFEEGSFDAAYQIEATVHAPDPVGCYRNIFKALKPGGAFAGYEWCVSDDFDVNNPDHVKAKAEIELGNGLPDMLTCKACKAALEEAGFVVEYAEDLAPLAEVAWWEPLSQTYLSAIFDIDRQLRCYGDTNEGTRYCRTLVGDSPELCVSLDAFGFADLKCAVVYNAALSSVYGIDDPRRFNLGTPRQVFDSLRRAWEVAPTSERICEDIERLPRVLKVRDMPFGPHMLSTCRRIDPATCTPMCHVCGGLFWTPSQTAACPVRCRWFRIRPVKAHCANCGPFARAI